MSKSLNDLSKSQIQAVLDFLNKAQNPSDITDIQQYKPNITEDELKSYSIGESAAANILETRKQLRSERFNSITEVLAVKGVGEDKVMDIVRCIWQSAEETFRSYLFGNMLGGNWKIDFWSYEFEEEEFQRLTWDKAALTTFVANKVGEIVRARHGNYVIGGLAKALLEKCHLDYESDPFFAQQQLTTWWYRFDMDNWFSYERVSEAVGTFINHYPNSNMEIAFFRGFTNSGTVAEAVTPNDLVVSLNREELVVTIWGVSLYD